MCRWLVWGFVAAYAAALVLLIVGLFGLFGSERDPLAGVFLIPLGLPWVLWAGRLPEVARPVAGALAPLVNLAVIVGICRAVRRGGGV
jgi:hypothetical protein